MRMQYVSAESTCVDEENFRTFYKLQVDGVYISLKFEVNQMQGYKWDTKFLFSLVQLFLHFKQNMNQTDISASPDAMVHHSLIVHKARKTFVIPLKSPRNTSVKLLPSEAANELKLLPSCEFTVSLWDDSDVFGMVKLSFKPLFESLFRSYETISRA
ncbi:uncharacterized protein V6R79_005633 [Siganus canaliculatus]